MFGKHLFRALGLSMLVLVGAMAVSASAAQAKWSIKRNGVSVNSAKLVANIVLSSELLVAGLEFSINCGGGTAAVDLEIIEGGKNLAGFGTVNFTECEVINFQEVCTIQTPGQAAGTISASGSGFGQMEGAKTFTELVSAEFTTVVISGEECPLTELEFVISGSGTGTLVNAATEQKTHVVEVDEKSLFFGEEPVSMHGSGEEESNVEVIAEEVTGQPWAIQLVGL